MYWRRRCRLAAVLLFVPPLIAVASPAAPVSVTNAAGRPLTLAAPARRIVSLAPNITELVYAAGAGNRLVGVSAYSDYPAAARHLPVIGNAGQIDFERVLALHPDLAIAWGGGSPGAAVRRLRALGVPVFVTRAHRLKDIPATLVQIGTLAGTPKAAAAAAARYRERLSALRRRYRPRRPVTVFLQISASPLMTLNGEHIASDVLGLCGGVNIFANLPQLADPVALEAVYQRDPQVILIADGTGDASAAVAQWKTRKDLAAVRAHHVFAVSPDTLVRATPRILDGAAHVCRLLDRVRK